MCWLQVHRLHAADDVQLSRVRLGDDHRSSLPNPAPPQGPSWRPARTLPRKWTVSSLSELYSQKVDRFFSVRTLFTKSGSFLLCQSSIHKDWTVSSLSETLLCQKPCSHRVIGLPRKWTVSSLSKTLFTKSNSSTS